MKTNRVNNISVVSNSQYPHTPANSKLNGRFNGNAKRKHNCGGYFYAPDKIFHLGLKPYHMLVFLYLCRRADKAGTSTPSQYTIAKELRVSKSTVIRAIKGLVSRNLISVESIIGDEFKQNKYKILLNSKGGVGVTQTPTLVSHRHPKDSLKEKDYINNCSSSNSLCIDGKDSKHLKDTNTNGNNKINTSSKGKKNTHTHKKEKDNNFYMDIWHALSNKERYSFDLKVAMSLNSGPDIKFTGEENAELNHLRIQTLKELERFKCQYD